MKDAVAVGDGEEVNVGASVGEGVALGTVAVYVGVGSLGLGETIIEIDGLVGNGVKVGGRVAVGRVAVGGTAVVACTVRVGPVKVGAGVDVAGIDVTVGTAFGAQAAMAAILNRRTTILVIAVFTSNPAFLGDAYPSGNRTGHCHQPDSTTSCTGKCVLSRAPILAAATVAACAR